MSKHKMIDNAPDVIYLQWYHEDAQFGVTWCDDMQNNDDIEYRRAEYCDVSAQVAAKYIMLTSVLLDALTDAEKWVSKLSADVPAGMVGNGAIINRSLDKIRAAIDKATTND